MGVPEPFAVDFDTLGDLAEAWIKRHCRIPDGFHRGKPFVLSDWQFECVAQHYRIRPGIVFDPENPPKNEAFVHRRSQIVAPQKTGKGPMSAAVVALEACGPSLFAGWAAGGEAYLCSEHGCPCGWGEDDAGDAFVYGAGEPLGWRHPSPLIQLTATSEDQVANVYRPLTAMIRLGPLRDLMAVREGFIRITGLSEDENMDRIDVVTASANARLGNPISFALQDETGLYTRSNRMVNVAETQRRGAAGMGGRTMETTNCWDPSQDSVAQRTYESTRSDIFRFYKPPPAHLSYRNKRERAQIHRHVYAGSPWVNLDSIEAEAAELLELDPAQAERFFGNRVVSGHGSWLPDGVWSGRLLEPLTVPAGAEIALGFDGSEVDDWTVIRAETRDGHQFTPTYGPDSRPTLWNPAEWGGRIPRSEVAAAVDELCSRYRVARMYCDPREWQSEIESWALKHGEKVVVEWATYRIVQMHAALERMVTDLAWMTHDGCKATDIHIGNARKLARPGERYLLGKPSQTQKIDAAMGSVLAHEAASDARISEWSKPVTQSFAWMT